jgi:hypothetical protein
MAQWVLCTDFNNRGTLLRAGKVLDDTLYNIPLITAAGAILTPANSATLARATFLQRGVRKGEAGDFDPFKDKVDVGAQGGSGGGAANPPGPPLVGNTTLLAADTWKLFAAGAYTISVPNALPGVLVELTHVSGNLDPGTGTPVTLSRGAASYTIEDPQTGPPASPRTAANSVVLSTNNITYRFRLDATANILRCEN